MLLWLNLQILFRLLIGLVGTPFKLVLKPFVPVLN